MISPTSLGKQYEAASGDPIRVLIAGAGIAGVTAAGMLRKAGIHPVLIERNTDQSHPGYMLALMPMVDAVLDDLEVREHYRRDSVPLSRYGLHSHKGKLMRVDSMAAILDRYGDYRGIARGELLESLTISGCPVSFGTIVTAIDQTENGCYITFRTGEDRQRPENHPPDAENHPPDAENAPGGTDMHQRPEDSGPRLEFDLVVVADGIHSATRELVLGRQEPDIVDTKWGGWVVWAPEDENMDLGEELWGAGFFIGVYPVKGQLGVFLGGAREHTKAGPDAFVAGIRRKLTTVSPRMESCLRAVSEAADPYFWSLTDCRCPQWAFDRTVLLGDAAAGFLPTAGIGAGMAMESAWVLTRMLRHATRGNLPLLLRAYEISQRPRVEAAQNSSRGLARIMFRQSRMLALLRDWAMRLVSVEAAIKPIQKLVARQPDPDAIARNALKAH